MWSSVNLQKAYTTNSNLGSPAKVYDLLTTAAKDHPVAGNAHGSYLTMRSQEGAIFFVINLVGNFGTVFMDNGTCLGSFHEYTSSQGNLLTCSTRVLQQSHRGESCSCSSWVRDGRPQLVRYSMACGYHDGPLRACSGIQSSLPNLSFSNAG